MRSRGGSPSVAVVTGAGQGIGRAIAHRFASEGMRVLVNDLDPERAAEVCAEIRGRGGGAAVHVGDVSDRADVERLSEQAGDWAGRADVLVNNAGIGDPITPTEEQDVDRWQRVVDVVLRGPYLCSRQFARDFMLPAGFGRIVNIASIAGLAGLPMRTAYSPAKAGLVMMTKTLGVEWAGRGITVNAVAPGYIATEPLLRAGAAGRLDLDVLRRRIPVGELGRPDDIARAVSFLASPESGYLTGVTVPVDGGWTAFGAAGAANGPEGK